MKLIYKSLVAATALAVCVASAEAQGTAFTYQGELNSGGAAANGKYDLTFTLFNASTGGGTIGSSITNSATAVSNGLFTVTLDFGNAFDGVPLWLAVGVRSNGSTGSFTALTPRQELTPVPYSEFTSVANVANSLASGSVSAPQLNTAGPAPTNGQVLSYNGSSLTWSNSASGAAGWSLTGNAGTTPGADFLGTTDNEPLQLRANGAIAMNLQGNPNNNNSVNISGGYWAAVGLNVFGVTDFGGGFGGPNTVYSDYDTIGGGFNNTINPAGIYGTIPGGNGNVVSGGYGFAAGQQAQALHTGAFVWSDGTSGAFASTANNQFSVHATGGIRFVTGGAGMTIDGVSVTGGGGGGSGSGWSLTGNAGTTPGQNFLGTTDDAALELHVNGARGWQLQPTSDSPNVIGGAPGNYVAPGIVGSTIAGGGTVTLYGAAFSNSIFAYDAAISGGIGNTISSLSYESAIGGGNQNMIQSNSTRSVIGGGYENTIQTGSYSSVIGGGANNSVAGGEATVPGGYNNSALGYGSFAAGVNAHTTFYDSFIWGDGSQAANSTGANRFEVLATGGVRFYTGGAGMLVDGVPVTGGGGGGGGSGWNLTGNAGTSPGADFLGTTDYTPLELHVDGIRALKLEPTTDSPNVIGGAPGNYIAGGAVGSTIGGGGVIDLYGGSYTNTILDSDATIGGGIGNTILSGSYESTIAGGNQNFVRSNSYRSTIGGGFQNTVAGVGATVPGGLGNSASGTGSFAAGNNAHTAYNGSFIWGDGTQPANATGANRFEVLATGGLNFFTANGVFAFQGGSLGVNTSAPSQALEVNGEFMMVDGDSGLQCYVGDDGYGNDVQIGSLVSGVTQVSCYNEADAAYMALNVSSITIHGGSDLAEPFKLSPAEKEISQGSVLIIDDQHPGQLKLSGQPYDTRVAGIVSGANGISPGIQMQQEGVLEGGKNVALSGRVYVHADASNGAIRPGDLLTTSATPGCAMKVTDHARAQGAILGKAMSGLSDGTGMVLVLVTLQ